MAQRFLLPTLLLIATPVLCQERSKTIPWPDRFDNPEPTAEETLLLSLVNEFRADPGAMAEAIRANAKGLGREPYEALDWKMFLDECHALKPSPPLVHELSLEAPAREHAFYTLFNRHWGHEEKEGMPYFSGRWPQDRLKAAGVTFRALENAGTGRPGPWSMIAGLVLDDGPGGPGGMQKGRGHRAAIHNPKARVGCAGIFSRERLSPFTFYVGDVNALHLGGVTFVDCNANGKFDVGEGLDGVQVQVGSAPLGTSWTSGGYGIRLEGTPPKKIKFTYRGLEMKVPTPFRSENFLANVDFSEPMSSACAKLLTRLERTVSQGKEPSKKELQTLLYLVEGTPLPDDLAARLRACIQPVQTQWEETRKELSVLRENALSAIDSVDKDSMNKALRAARQELRHVQQQDWFTVASDVFDATRRIHELPAGSERDAKTRQVKTDLLRSAHSAKLRQRIRAIGAKPEK